MYTKILLCHVTAREDKTSYLHSSTKIEICDKRLSRISVTIKAVTGNDTCTGIKMRSAYLAFKSVATGKLPSYFISFFFTHTIITVQDTPSKTGR